jgi:3',5'-nucleoside bisphosphate phosphatase
MNKPRFDRLDPHTINADLHCHSDRSDGALPPAQVAARAAQNGVQLWSLTDHDELSGIAEARAAAQSAGLHFIAGVEVSVTWGGETIHVVGLNINDSDPILMNGLQRTREGRDARGREMGHMLEAVGVKDAYEGALSIASNPGLLGRTHFARFIVSQGYCSSVGEVFQRYMTPGKPGYVEHRWAKLSEAVEWISAAGGVAVMAHPGRYRLSENHLHLLLEEFKQCGGQAIEVVCGSHTKDQYSRFGKLAKQLDFKASRGSDFHAPDESHVELGRLPPLPDWLVPVWHQFV